mgnify:FL=1
MSTHDASPQHQTTATPGGANWHFDTMQTHAGASPAAGHGAHVTPIVASAGFTFDNVDHAASIFSMDTLNSFAYARAGNPTNAVVEQRLAALEGGAGAVLTASGQAATVLALLSIVRSGDHVVASSQIYGGTVGLLNDRFAELGISVSYVDEQNDGDAWRRAARPETRAFIAESISNPLCTVLDTRLVADVAHEIGVPLIVDNTLATPYLSRPLEHGADIVVHSTTKFLAGHGAVIGGAVIDGATFDFGREPEKWPALHTPSSPGEAGLWERFSPLRLAYLLRVRALLRDYGPSASPFNAFLLLLGIETLSLRMRQHVANAREVVAFLSEHPLVAAVHYAELPDSAWRAAAATYLPNGAGSVFSFELHGGIEAGKRFIAALKLFSHIANIGDVRSLAIQPASTTHSPLTESERASVGIPAGLIRLSIGIEDARDLLADLSAALDAAHTDTIARDTRKEAHA